MKKLIVFGLISSIILTSGLVPAFAQTQSDTDTLLKLVADAKDQVDRQLANINEIPPEIDTLYREGISAIDALHQSISTNNQDSIKEQFLNVMNIFKQITTTLSDTQSNSAHSPESSSQQSPSKQPDYESNLNRLKKLISTLKLVAQNQPSIDFSKVDRLVAQATEQIQNNDHDNIRDTINKIKAHLDEIQDKLYESSASAATARDIEFFTNIVQKLENEGSISENYLNEIKHLLLEFQQLISDEEYEEAKKIKQVLTSKIKEAFKS